MCPGPVTLEPSVGSLVCSAPGVPPRLRTDLGPLPDLITVSLSPKQVNFPPWDLGDLAHMGLDADGLSFSWKPTLSVFLPVLWGRGGLQPSPQTSEAVPVPLK